MITDNAQHYKRLVTNTCLFSDYLYRISIKYVEQAMERLKNQPKTESTDRNYSVLENLLIKTEDPNKAVAMALDMMLAGIDTVRVHSF